MLSSSSDLSSIPLSVHSAQASPSSELATATGADASSISSELASVTSSASSEASSASSSTGTNLGPLTTTYTFPTPCTYIYSADDHSYKSYLIQTCLSGSVVDDPKCWPTTTSTVAAVATAGIGAWGYYSPGLICPASWTSACSATAIAGLVSGQSGSVTGHFDFQFSLTAGQTAVGCCPH